MPKKSRRVAVRQAELGQRKRRTNRSGANQAAQTPAPRVADPAVETHDTTAAAPETPTTAQAAPSVAPAPATPRAAPQPPPAPTPAARPASPYMMPELRRIGILAVLMLVILGVLTAVLG